MPNRNLSEGQFRYETRIKDKPNSQGTLFQVSPEARTPESRQPRGYSKERYEAVGKSLDLERENNKGPRDDSKFRFRHPHGGVGMHVYPGHAEQMARTWASVARSTIPMSDITQPHPDQPASNENPTLHVGIWNKTAEEAGESGHYSRPGTSAMKNQARIAIMNSANHRDDTVLHEVGHHVDYMRGRPYGTAEEQGRAEGFADAYADKHARQPGYKRKPYPPEEGHPEAWSSHINNQNLSMYQFTKGYHQENPRPAINVQEELKADLGDKTYPKGHIQGQQSLLSKSGEDYRPGSIPRYRKLGWRYGDFVTGEDTGVHY